MQVTVRVLPHSCFTALLPLEKAHGKRLNRAARGVAVLDFTVEAASIFLEPFSKGA